MLTKPINRRTPRYFYVVFELLIKSGCDLCDRLPAVLNVQIMLQTAATYSTFLPAAVVVVPSRCFMEARIMGTIGSGVRPVI